MTKNLLLIFLVLCCGGVRAQETDSLITITGRVIKCKVTKIENGKIYYQRNGPDWTKEIKDVAELIIDKQSTKRKMNVSEIDSIFHSKRQTPDSLLINIKELINKRKLNKLAFQYFRQTIKINPGSFINEYTLKYEYRLSERIGLLLESGYVHSLEKYEHKTLHSYFETIGRPFAFRGVVARAGIRYYFINTTGRNLKSISMNLLYKNQQHEKLGFILNGIGDILSTHRTVYGINFILSTIRYYGHFMVELYVGFSLRGTIDQNKIYKTYDILDTQTDYSPPKETVTKMFLPGIQGGINIGFGFNGKKKSE